MGPRLAFTQARGQDGKEIGFKIESDMVGWLLLSSPKLHMRTHGPVELFERDGGEISSSIARHEWKHASLQFHLCRVPWGERESVIVSVVLIKQG